MANATPFDFDATDAEFEATYAQLLVALKRNYDSAGNLMGDLDHALAIRFDLAERQNLIDDFILACRPRVKWLNFGTGSPEGVVVANTGAIYFNDDPGDGFPLWTKQEDDGAATGWVAINTSENAPDAIALAGHAACSVVGRSANSSGNAADIAIAEGQFLGRRSNVVGSYALQASDIVVAGSAVVLAQTGQPLAITDTTTPADLVNYSIPANTLTANRSIRVRMGGTYVNNSGGTRIFTLALTLDGTTLYQDGSNSNGASALVTAWEIEFTVSAESATVVHMRGRVQQHTTNAPGTGLGALDNAGQRVDATISTVSAGVTVGSLTSGARVLALTFAHPVATTLQSMVRTHYSVELLP